MKFRGMGRIALAAAAVWGLATSMAQATEISFWTWRQEDKAAYNEMFADFTKGHWLTLYRNRFPASAPPVEVRVMTRDRREGVALADDVPNAAGYPAKFMFRLIAAWVAMGFRRPDIPWGKAARS